MSDWVNIVLSSVTSGGLAGAVVIWLSREWISARLKGSIQHEYNQQLELHKAQLKAEHEIALLNIKTALERQATIHAVAHASFAEGQKASMERRLSAVERLWAEVLRLRAALPSVVTFRDVMTADEYRTSQNHERFRKLTGDITAQTAEAIKALSLNAAIEQVRPYVGEYMWAIFYGYHAILIRMLVILQLGSAEEWHQDKGTRSLIESVLTRTELAQFDNTSFGKTGWLTRKLESKLLDAAAAVVSGESFGAASLEQAQLIQERIARLNH